VVGDQIEVDPRPVPGTAAILLPDPVPAKE
jgi:hypothetical protein